MQLGRKGGLGWNGLLTCGMGGGGEKASLISDVSTSRTQESESGCSQGGGIMLQRRWRLRRRANQRGRVVRWGGRRAFVGPCDGLVLVIARWVRGVLTWRGRNRAHSLRVVRGFRGAGGARS